MNVPNITPGVGDGLEMVQMYLGLDQDRFSIMLHHLDRNSTRFNLIHLGLK